MPRRAILFCALQRAPFRARSWLLVQVLVRSTPYTSRRRTCRKGSNRNGSTLNDGPLAIADLLVDERARHGAVSCKCLSGGAAELQRLGSTSTFDNTSKGKAVSPSTRLGAMPPGRECRRMSQQKDADSRFVVLGPRADPGRYNFWW